MRVGLLAMLASLPGCNQLLGIEDPPALECRTDDDCGSHAFCSDEVALRACECAAGYAPGPGGCAWVGVVADPGFSGAAWTAKHGAVLDGAAPAAGLKDPGVARMPITACAAAVSQRVVMPRHARAEPLVASLTYRSPSTIFAELAPVVGLGTAWTELPRAGSTTWTTVRRCLGGGQYASPASTGRGEEVELTIGRTLDDQCRTDPLEIDRFEILPAAPGECPEPGQVVNGLADADGGWTFTMADGGVAGFAAGAGEGGSRGARLTMPQICSKATAEVPLSAGGIDAAGSPALSYFVAASANTAVFVEPGERLFRPPQRLGGPVSTTVRACVPAHLRGAFSLLHVRPSSLTGGTCTDPFGGAAALDTVVLRQEPGCGTDPAIADPGFESGYLPLEHTISATGSVASIADPGAHSGARMLEMRETACNPTGSRFTVYVIVPPPVANAGPRLTYWYRSGPGSNSGLAVFYESLSVGPPRSSTWQQVSLCLDPKRAGRAQPIQFFLNPGSCAGSYPAESTFIDDLEVSVDPACPAR
jgi:hypothetical protein